MAVFLCLFPAPVNSRIWNRNLAASLAPRLALPLVAGARLRMVTLLSDTDTLTGLGSAEPWPEK